MTSSFEGNPLTHEHKILSLLTRVLGTAYSVDIVILACVVLTQYRNVTNERTHRQTDASTMDKIRLALRAMARKN